MLCLANAAASSYVVLQLIFLAMASLLPESENSFYEVRMSASCSTPNLKGRCVFVQHLAQNLSVIGSPTSN
jgi:hypothetical protein